jgi:hypothetical protein
LFLSAVFDVVAGPAACAWGKAVAAIASKTPAMARKNGCRICMFSFPLVWMLSARGPWFVRR